MVIVDRNKYSYDQEWVPATPLDEEHAFTPPLVDDRERDGLARGLKQRHVQMIAIAGAIGTGLFLGLGSSIVTAGPLGALLAYIFVGCLVACVQFALGEVSALLPVTGSFVRHAEVLVDPAMAVAVGWNLVYGSFMSVPSEISAGVVLIQFWTEKVNPAVWVTVLLVLSVLVAIIFVGIYGEVEFVFAILKILLVLGVVLMGLIIDLGGVPGHPRLGFHYWKYPGPFAEYIASGSWGCFLGFWSVMSSAVYSFAGIESLAMAAAETRNPRVNIPRACKRVFVRLLLFYVAAILIVGMIVSSKDPRLRSDSGNAATSPFVLAARDAGIHVVPSIINAVVLTSAWSSSNQAILSGTRTLYGLALKGHAPAFFLRTTRFGVPYMCVLSQVAVALLGYMSVSNDALNVFYWFVDLTACGTLISWCAILFNHTRLMRALRRQRIEPSELPWHTACTGYLSYIALAFCIILLLTGGFSVFTNGNWSASSFVTSYLDIPIVLVLYVAYKLWRRTKWIPLDQIPLRQAIEEARTDPDTEKSSPSKWQQFNILWG